MNHELTPEDKQFGNATPHGYVPQGWREKSIDIGHGHYLQPVVMIEGQDERPAGWILWHEMPDGQVCGGSVPILGIGPEDNRPKWSVEILDPLTLSPSIICHCKRTHGFVRGGRWVVALRHLAGSLLRRYSGRCRVRVNRTA